MNKLLVALGLTATVALVGCGGAEKAAEKAKEAATATADAAKEGAAATADAAKEGEAAAPVAEEKK
ncbi:MAG: hypothetical protein Q4D05_05080 [Acinetobacter sp.]|nr:hypothetical protein [Acinetobacter sp.]